MELAAEGKGIVCATPKEVAERADFIFYCVGDTAMSRAVGTGKNGLLEGIRPGSVTADCSTISPAVSQEIGAAFAAKGVHFLDAPCTGSKAGAENGTLTFMIGGDQGAFDRAKPYFETMGKRFYYCGAAGQGLQRQAHPEPGSREPDASICRRHGAGDQERHLAGVDAGHPGQQRRQERPDQRFKAPFILARDFRTNFSTKWMHKDVGLGPGIRQRHGSARCR